MHIFSSFMMSYLTKFPKIVESNVLSFQTINAFLIVTFLKMIHFMKSFQSKLHQINK